MGQADRQESHASRTVPARQLGDRMTYWPIGGVECRIPVLVSIAYGSNVHEQLEYGTFAVPVMRQVARIELPSTRQPIIPERSCRLNLFIACTHYDRHYA